PGLATGGRPLRNSACWRCASLCSSASRACCSGLGPELQPTRKRKNANASRTNDGSCFIGRIYHTQVISIEQLVVTGWGSLGGRSSAMPKGTPPRFKASVQGSRELAPPLTRWFVIGVVFRCQLEAVAFECF